MTTEAKLGKRCNGDVATDVLAEKHLLRLIDFVLVSSSILLVENELAQMSRLYW